jgi:hypothetical protein
MDLGDAQHAAAELMARHALVGPEHGHDEVWGRRPWPSGATAGTPKTCPRARQGRGKAAAPPDMSPLSTADPAASTPQPRIEGSSTPGRPHEAL